MKIKRLFKITLTALTFSSFIGTAPKQTPIKKVEAATTDKWSIIGGGTSLGSWNKDIPLTLSADSKYFEITLDLNVNDTFKFRKDNAWSVVVGAGGGTTSKFGSTGSPDYNIKCLTAGRWRLGINVDAAGYGDKTYAFSDANGIAERVALVTYYNGTEIIGETDNITLNSAFSAKHISQTGYTLEGWYTDASLTTRYVKGTIITGSMSLYGKYLASSAKYVYVKNNPRWTTINAYLWNYEFGNYNKAWAGAAMTKVPGTDIMYYYQVAAEGNYDRVIFNNGTAETGTEDLKYGSTLIYNISPNSFTLTSYNSSTNKVVLEGDIISSAENDCFQYTGSAATSSDVYYIHLVDGVVVAEPVTDRELRISMIKSYIMDNAGCNTTIDMIEKYRDLFDTLTIEEQNNPELTVVQERLDYIQEVIDHPENYLKGGNSKGLNGLLEGNNVVSLLALLVVGVIGLSSICGYYFFMKKKNS